jgi:hypothetical protein
MMGGAAGCGTLTAQAASTSHISHRAASTHHTAKPAAAHKIHPGFTPLPKASPARPLKVMVIGDSLGEDLQYGLADIVGSSSSVDLIQEAYGSSGLVNLAYHNWPVIFEALLRQYHPQLVYVEFGANDSYSYYQNGRYVPFGSVLWRKDYGGRVNQILNEAVRAHAHVIWVGLPIMSGTSVLSNVKMQQMNALFASEVRRHPAMAAFVPLWKLFQNRQGQFTEYMTDSAGTSVMVRDPDGVHIAPPAGQELMASYVLYRTEQLGKTSLCVNGSDLWTQYPLHACPAK